MSAVIQNEYTGNGSTTQYSFTFPYLKATDIKASLDAVETTAFTLPNATTLQFNTAPSDGAKIKIFRETGVDDLTATFYAGSAIKSEDLNDNFTQNLYKTQEVGARAISALGGTMTGNLILDTQADLVFEGSTANDHETTIKVVDPTADRTITFPNVTGTVVTTGDTGTVATDMIAGDAVTGAKIADNAINSEHYTDGSIDRVHLAADIVDGTKIEDDSINSEHYVADSIDTEHYAAGSVDATALASNAVTRVKIIADAVDGTKIADSSIDSEHYVNGSIDTEHLGNDIVDGSHIQDNVINSEHYVDGSVDTAHLADNAVTNAKMADSAVGTSELVDTAVTTAKLADNSVTMSKLSSGTLPTDITVASANLVDGTVATADIADNAITTAKIADAELSTLAGMQSGTASKLADSTALTADIADLNQIDGLTKQTTISDSDASFPTSGAVVDYVAAQIAPLGGLEVVATEVAFPNTQPAAGVVISISDAGGVVVGPSGQSQTGRTVNGTQVTINSFPSSLHSETLVAGVGLMVSSTGSGQIYNYHKILGKEDDIKQLSDDINDFNSRYRVGSSNPANNNDAGDLFFNTDTSKLLVYNATNTAWEEAQSIGNFFISTLSPAFNGSIQDFTITNAPANAQQILLSINGVVQKPNAGTSTPSEGFALSGSTVKLAAAPASGSIYHAVVLGSTVNIGTPSNNTVSTAVLQNSSVTTAKIADDAVTTAKIADSAVTSAKIADGAIVNADVNASAAIAGSKLNPVGLSNVGINSATTNYELQVNDSSGTVSVIQLTNTTTGTGAGDGFLVYNNGVHAILSNEEVGDLRLQTSGTQRLVIDSDGKIDLNASVAKFGNSHSTGTTYLFGHDIRFTNAGITTTTMTIDGSAGNVGIGSTSPGYRLDLKKDSTTAYSASASPSNVIARIHNGSAQDNSHASLLLTAVNSNSAHDFWWMSCVSQTQNYNGFLAFTGRTSVGASQELVRFRNNGDVDINAGNLNFASGNGIDFSATGDSSGTMSSELFNDYEEGTFTPTLGWSLTPTTNNGRYTRIGRMVYYTLQMVWPSTTNLNYVLIGSLPFDAMDGANAGGAFIRYTNYSSGGDIKWHQNNDQTLTAYHVNGSTITNSVLSTLRMDLVGFYIAS